MLSVSRRIQRYASRLLKGVSTDFTVANGGGNNNNNNNNGGQNNGGRNNNGGNNNGRNNNGGGRNNNNKRERRSAHVSARDMFCGDRPLTDTT